MSLEKKIIFIGVPVFAAMLMAVFYYLGNQIAPASSSTEKVPAGNGSLPATLLYSNQDFKVSLQYPSSWKAVTDKGGFKGKPLYFKGNDGFFGIDALGANASGAVSVDDVVKQLVSDKSNPYGTSPSITTPDTGEIESRLITPSPDQPPAKNGETALIIKYPKPVTIGTDTFLFLMLYGDKGHLGDIASSLQFINL